jgi:hypothetical protein
MKFDLTIRDVTSQEIQDVLDFFKNRITVEQHPVTVAQQPVIATIPTVEPQPLVSNTEYDSAGIPWDARIHAGSKNKTTNGRWRTKRGATDEEVAQIENELRGIVASAASPQMSVSPEPEDVPLPFVEGAPMVATPAVVKPFQAPSATPVAAHTPAPMQQAVPIIPVQQQTPAQYWPPTPPVQQQQPVAADMNGVLNRIQQLYTSGRVAPDYVLNLQTQLSQAFGVQVVSITDIAGRPDMLGHAMKLMEAA